MSLEEALTLARAFSHFLNLMGIAETHHRVHKVCNVPELSRSCNDIFSKLFQSGISPDELYETVCKQGVEIVLTAHPTQINRRTLQCKHIRMAHLLEYNDRPDLGLEDREAFIEDLVREITSLLQTDELRRQKPTPVDEARAVLNIVEQSLWKAVPHYLRRVSSSLKKLTGKPLPLTCTPIKFGFWMGGDRDGNSNVTAKLLLKFTLKVGFECWEKPTKFPSQQGFSLFTQLPPRADLPSCAEYGESQYSKLEVPVIDFMPLSRQDAQSISSNGSGQSLQITIANGTSVNSNGSQQILTPRGSSSSSCQLRQKKLFAESQNGRTNFQKLLVPTQPKRAGIAPYRIVLGDLKEKLLKTRRLLEFLLEGLPCEYDPCDYYETSDQLLEPLLLCYESLQSSMAEY